ncbi:hypothetical protein [Mesorhizobium sp. WSM2239]
MAALGESSHGYLIDVAEALAVYLPKPSLERWDQLLLALQNGSGNPQKAKKRRSYDCDASQLCDVRQVIARARNDLDGLIALEERNAHGRKTGFWSLAKNV